MSRIMTFLQSNQGWQDRYTIEIRTGLCKRQVQRHLRKLTQSGEIEARQVDNRFEYRWIDSSANVTNANVERTHEL